MQSENIMSGYDLVGSWSKSGQESGMTSLRKLSWEWKDEGTADSKNLSPVMERSISTLKKLIEGHWDWSSGTQSLEKCVVVTGR